MSRLVRLKKASDYYKIFAHKVKDLKFKKIKGKK